MYRIHEQRYFFSFEIFCVIRLVWLDGKINYRDLLYLCQQFFGLNHIKRRFTKEFRSTIIPNLSTFNKRTG